MTVSVTVVSRTVTASALVRHTVAVSVHERPAPVITVASRRGPAGPAGPPGPALGVGRIYISGGHF